jgi:hypothetical protein
MACNATQADIDKIVLDYYVESHNNNGITLETKFNDLGMDGDILGSDLRPLKFRIRNRTDGCAVSSTYRPVDYKQNKAVGEAAKDLKKNLS